MTNYPLEKKRHLFIGIGGTRTHDPIAILDQVQRLYQLSYDSDTVFQRTFLFNDYIDDTDDNTVDTIWLLDLQSIVEGVDPLDGHY